MSVSTSETLVRPDLQGSSASGDPVRILAAEDDLLTVTFLQAQIEALGHSMVIASDGQEALDILREHHSEIDVVLMDREMPYMDGITAVQRMKNDPALRKIPVVMVTGADSVEQMRQGLDAGVFYYLTKPVDDQMLRSVLSAAVREARQSKTLFDELSKHRASFNLIEVAKFRIRTLHDAESLAPFIAHAFPEPERVLPGLGELMINAVEHGIAEIGYEEKTRLLVNDDWRAEVERRTDDPNRRDKTAAVSIARKENGLYFIVEDPGPGFPWKDYLTIDLSRAGDSHGRGIALSKARSFDSLTYNEKGNKVIALVSENLPLDW